MDPNRYLILGATAKTGRRVAAKLDKMGCYTRALSRSTTPSFDWMPPLRVLVLPTLPSSPISPSRDRSTSLPTFPNALSNMVRNDW